jgi:hydrogenase maturation factor
MNTEQRIPSGLVMKEVPQHASSVAANASCERDAEGHCITCSDEALQARVLRIDEQSGVAFVMINDAMEEVDMSLVDDVAPGDTLLVHGGVAISRLDEASDA